MSHWVVGRARVAGSGDVWIWGKVGAGPGFDDTYYTAPDGWSPAGITDKPNMDEILFVVPIAGPIESEVASRRDTFPAETVPAHPATVGTPTGDED